MAQLILKYPCADLNGVKAAPLLPLILAVVPLRVTNPQAYTTVFEFIVEMVDARLVPLWNEISPLVVKEPMLFIPLARVMPPRKVSVVTDKSLVTNAPKGTKKLPRT